MKKLILKKQTISELTPLSMDEAMNANGGTHPTTITITVTILLSSDTSGCCGGNSRAETIQNLSAKDKIL